MVKIGDICQKLPPLSLRGDGSRWINKIVELDSYTGNVDELSWLNDKNLHLLLNFTTGNFICSEKALELDLSEGITLIVDSVPRKYFQKVLVNFFYQAPKLGQIASSAIIAQNVKFGANCSVGENTVIEANCVIGENVYIGHNNVILSGTNIKNDVYIGNNNTIGGVGFGYEKDDHGQFQLIPHIGNVEIHSNVEIGNNTCIDKGVLGSTVIGKNVKIDNLVHIAHNVKVGENSVIIANAMVGGSVTVGANTWVAPSVSIINGVEVGEDCLLGIASVVIKAVGNDQVMVGNPAREIKK